MSPQNAARIRRGMGKQKGDTRPCSALNRSLYYRVVLLLPLTWAGLA